MIVDHGCDSMTSIAMTTVFVHMMGVAPFWFYLILVIISLAFFFPNLEQSAHQVRHRMPRPSACQLRQ